MPRPGRQYFICPVYQCAREVEFKGVFRNLRTRSEAQARFCRKHVTSKYWPRSWGELLRYQPLTAGTDAPWIESRVIDG